MNMLVLAGILFLIALAQHETQVMVLHVQRRSAQPDTPRDENRLGVSTSERLKQVVARQELQRQLLEGNFGVIHQLRLTLFFVGVCADEGGEAFAELIEFVLLN